ncbi:hypothetical protein PUNSTDRAFT_145630 [Punctularia strigosozonata HHB-11173 SS5]|uniref:uncharacterized protein n=1 Tax=Punctularia strigosozonata (strain HHB-11173) TaxID=741275 RepID=UPI000441784C|nr:uncharacterized protein PUNSTDRAFT_145630 [Punctularia strigosozonata HHB-11173 SS5]EIN05669.1 hypothetical protein PUNSTDRAFT_145630 [Punctularia strigosozonata HHB-11173 SS5]
MFPASTSSSRHAQRDGRRSARGADIDEAGRRGSFTSDDKEGLPAYDGRGSPPKLEWLERGKAGITIEEDLDRSMSIQVLASSMKEHE